MTLTLGDFGRLNPAPIHGWNVATLDFLPVTVDASGALIVAGTVVGSAVDQGTGGLSAWLVTGTGGTFPITAVSLPLPTGASTAARQDTLLAELQLKADLTETQPVSAASLPLPTNAATESGNLATTVTRLTSILAQLDVALSTRAVETGGNLATTVTRLTSILAQLDVALSTRAVESGGNLATIAAKDFATQATLALIKAKTDNLDAALSALFGTLGQKAMAGSAPVVIASDQAAIPVTGTVSATSAADVIEPDADAGYTDGATGQPLTQTPDGRLRALASALVSDTPESYINGQLRSLSLNSDGRLRVVSVPSPIPTAEDLVMDYATAGNYRNPWQISASPWSSLSEG